MKRMIDNKEFEKVKNEVGNLETKVDNIKGIPTITIEASQMTDESHAQLTDEQFEILENNSFINVVFPDGTRCGFNCFVDGYEGYHLAMCSGGTSEITYYSAIIDSSTKIATLSIGDFSAGAKTYQHNLKLTASYGNRTLHVFLTIITSKYTTAMDFDGLLEYLASQDRYYEGNSLTKVYPATGGYRNAMSTPEYGIVLGVYKNTSSVSTGLCIVSMLYSTGVAGYGDYNYYTSTSTYTTISDDVKEV